MKLFSVLDCLLVFLHSTVWPGLVFFIIQNQINGTSCTLSPSPLSLYFSTVQEEALYYSIPWWLLSWCVVPGTQAPLPIPAGGRSQQGWGQQEVWAPGCLSGMKEAGKHLPIDVNSASCSVFPACFPAKLGLLCPNLPDFHIVACQICLSGLLGVILETGIIFLPPTPSVVR